MLESTYVIGLDSAQRHLYGKARGVPVVPGINTFHYHRGMDASTAAGGADVKRLLEWGVIEFQIGSLYEPAFRQTLKPRLTNPFGGGGFRCPTAIIKATLYAYCSCWAKRWPV